MKTKQNTSSGKRTIIAPSGIILFIVILFWILGGQKSFAQGVGISEILIVPHTSSILELKSTLRGFLAPRMTTGERDAIPTPATGLLIYNTTTNAFNYYNGGWTAILNIGTGVTSVSGTINRISIGGTATVPIIDIDANYIGQTSISTLGTITTGTWNSTAIGIAYGGTGQTTAQLAINALAGGVTSGQYLRGNGTNVVMSAIQASDVPTLNQNTTGTANIAGGTLGAIPYQTSANNTGVLASIAVANKVLMSGSSAAPVWSTPAFPNVSATSRKIIVSDGTNWIASAETYAVPGTSGNLLVSDGTNWISTLPTFNQNTTGTAANVTGTVAIVNGGTGATDAAGARSNLGLGTLATQNGTFSGTSSGTNTGDQTITLTGDVTGSGTGSFAATIANNAVNYSKMQAISTTSKLLGSSATTTSVQEITLGAGLSMTGSTLNAAASTFANPAATIGLTAINGSATTAMRSDAAPALSQAIVPTWTGAHTWSALGTFNLGLNALGATVNINAGSNNATNINTGTSTGAVTIGSNTSEGVRIGNGRVTINKPIAPITGIDYSFTATVPQILDAGIFGFNTTGTNRTLILPSAQGVNGLVQALPGTPAVGDVFTFVIFDVGSSASVVSLGVGAGITIVNNNTLRWDRTDTRTVTCRVTSVAPNAETISVY